MSLTEKTNRIKELMGYIKPVIVLNEGYREIDELAELADLAIKMFAIKNTKIVGDAFLYGIHDIKFQTNYLALNKIAHNVKFDVIAEFIKNTSIIIKFSNMKNNGSFNSYTNTIEINSGIKTFVPILEDTFDTYEENGDDVMKDAENILISSMAFAFRSVIIHELQHAYDSYVSNDLYRTDDKSNRYYHRGSDVDINQNTIVSPEEYAIYNSLPHEYWARFSQAVATIDFSGNKTMNDIIPEFQKKFVAWMKMSPTTKVRLNKALYKYFDNRKTYKNRKESEALVTKALENNQEKTYYSLGDDQG